MNYKEFFNIKIDHQYFSPESCTDLLILPTSNTRRFLSGQDYILKNNHDGIKVLLPLNNEGSPKPVFDKQDVLSFDVFPTSSSFSSYTTLSDLQNGEVYGFTNVGMTKTAKNLKVLAQPGGASHQGQQSIAKIEIHPTAQLLSQKGWPKAYNISFNAPSMKWKYYLLSSNGTTDLAIDDKQKKLTFIKTDMKVDTTDQRAQSLKTAYPKSNLFLFESSATIPYTVQVRKNIQLLRNGHVIINHLPNPTVKDNGIKIINMQK